MVPASLRPLVSGSNGRVRATWRGLVPFVASLVVVAVELVFLRVLVAPVLAALGIEVSRWFDQLLVGAVLLVGLVAGLALAARIDGRPVADYGFARSRSWVRDLAGGLAVGVAMAGAPVAVALALGYAEVAEVFPPGAGGLVVAPVAAVLFGQVVNVVFEETLFRGVMLQNFAEGLAERSSSPTRAALGGLLASSAVFGAWHIVFSGGGGVQGRSAGLVLSATMFGLVWGGAYLLTGRIALPIGIHLGYNLSNGVVFSVPPVGADGSLPSILAIASTADGFWDSMAPVLLRALAALVALLAWVALTRGSIRIVEDVPGYDPDASTGAVVERRSGGDRTAD